MVTVSSTCLATLMLLQAPAGWAGESAPLSQRQQALAAQLDVRLFRLPVNICCRQA